jgi:hypothetical protein
MGGTVKIKKSKNLRFRLISVLYLLFISLTVLQIPIEWFRINYSLLDYMNKSTKAELTVPEIKACYDYVDDLDKRYLEALGGYNPATGKYNFKTDLAFGKKGEDQVKRFLQGIVNGSFEVKSDRYRNGRMVVEIAQNPRKHGWKDSGLMVTEAQWWVYVYTLNEAMIVISTDRLKRYIKTLPESRIRLFAEGSNNPAKGYLLLPEEVMPLLYHSAHDGNVEE